MKIFGMLTLLAGTLFLTTGCETPGYTASEDFRNDVRNGAYDLRMTTDDFNDLFLLDRPSHLTRWAVQ